MMLPAALGGRLTVSNILQGMQACDCACEAERPRCDARRRTASRRTSTTTTSADPSAPSRCCPSRPSCLAPSSSPSGPASLVATTAQSPCPSVRSCHLLYFPTLQVPPSCDCILCILTRLANRPPLQGVWTMFLICVDCCPGDGAACSCAPHLCHRQTSRTWSGRQHGQSVSRF